MRTTTTIAAAVLLVLAPVGFAPLARAQSATEDPTTSMARARFKEGVDFYDKGAYEQARASFLQAYALKKHPAVLLNLAWSCVRSGHPIEADRYFRQFLTEGKDITDKQRSDANDGLAQARAKVGRIEVVAGLGTEVTVDGERVGTAPLAEPLTVEAGAHTIKFRGSDGTADTQSITVMGGEKAVARFKGASAAPPLPAPPAPETAPPPVAPPPPPAPPPELAAPEDSGHTPSVAPVAETATIEPRPSKGVFAVPSNVAPVVILGAVAVAGYAGAIAALVFKQEAQDKADSVVAALKSRGVTQCPSAGYANYCDAYATDNSNVNDDATGGNIALGVGIAATAGAIVYWLVADKGDGARTALRPAVAPLVGPNIGGISLSTSF